MDHWERLQVLESRRSVAGDRAARELVGTVGRIVWAAEDGSAAIARLESGETVRGPILDGEELVPHVAYRFLGRWEDHPRYGRQFSWQTYVKDAPHSRTGVVKYLQEEAPNVGKKRAEQLWEAFGSEAVAVLRTEPNRAVAAGILSAEAAREASDALQKAARLEKTKIDLFALFAGRGFPGKLIRACIDLWGARAAEQVKANPFSLLLNELPGAGFQRCDRLYLDLGGRRDRLKRQTLCAWNALRQDTAGNTWLRKGAVIEAINKHCAGPKVNPEAAIALGVRGGWLAIREQPAKVWWVAEFDAALAERRIADRLRDLCKTCVVRWPSEFPPELGLSEHQLTELARALKAPIGVLAGTPGTGKTFTAAAVIKQIVAHWGKAQVAVCAPTGKAAVRLTAAMQRYQLTIQAVTIHRLLEIGRNGHDGRGWGFARNRDNPLPQRFLFVDESSMIDAALLADLFDAAADGTHVLLIGDPYQLPPVGRGAPLRDLIAAGVPCGLLREIRRQDGRSLIVEACARIKDGQAWEVCEKVDLPAGRNLRHFETRTPEEQIEVLRALLARFRAAGQYDPIWDVQVLVPLNGKSPLGRKQLNRILQAELNPEGKTADGNPFRVGDKAICLKNGWAKKVRLSPGAPADETESYADSEDDIEPEAYVANGDVGRVLAVSSRVVVLQFGLPERLVAVPIGRKTASEEEDDQSGSDYDLAYAITTHKSQGSEWPVAVVLIDDQAGFVASREHLYTSVSRAARLCVTIGRLATAHKQMRRQALNQRKTFLRELIEEGRARQ
ncbi:MAG TPA: AAA family ATPase [Gemmataceae bacterium]|nr:AAA family ATPase [Gemmataceae bacterium]